MGTALRLSAMITCLSLSVFFLAQWLELVPDRRVEALKTRKAICETLAIHSSLEIQKGDFKTLGLLSKAVQARTPEISYIAVRFAAGKIVAEAGKPRGAAAANASRHVARVPIMLADKLWGHFEVEFEPLDAATSSWDSAVLANPEVRLIGFMASAGYLTYFCYSSLLLRRMRKHGSGPVPKRVREALNSFSEGILVLDRQDQIAFANTAFAELIRESADDLAGRKASDLHWQTHDDSEAAIDLPWRRSSAERSPQRNSLLKLTNGAGDTSLLSVNATPLHDDDGTLLGAFATMNDQTPIQKKNSVLERLLKRLRISRNTIREKNQELLILASRDPLTKCLNRRAFMEALDSHWNAAGRYGHSLSFILVDVDHFKSVNDRFGHSVGDDVLVQVARVLNNNSRQSDIVCRYGGGEEFCVVATHTDEAGACRLAETLRQTIAELTFPQLSITASFGVSSYHIDTANPQAMLDQADAALYLAKHSGRNQVKVWNDVVAAERPPLKGPTKVRTEVRPEAAAARG